MKIKYYLIGAGGESSVAGSTSEGSFGRLIVTEAAVQAAFGVLAVEFSSWASLFALGGGTGAAGECRAWTTSDYWTRLTLRLSCLILKFKIKWRMH